MIGKLLENWLDNASERSYQQVFVQMLSAQGYTVLHSTRHCLLEFGKDVLAIAPDGVGCAFQLKGDPRGQMTIGAFRSGIQQQVVQLLAQCPSYPGFPTGVHRSYLVSNGSFSEEVQVAISQMNSVPYPSKLELWSRGTLLDMAVKTSESLWPSEIQDTRRLLDIYMADPRDQLSLTLLAEMLTSILHLGDGDDALKEGEFTLHGLLAALYLADLAEACLQPDSSTALREWICNGPRPMLWGEAAVGQIFSMALALGRMGQVDAMGKAISEVAVNIIAANQSESICAYPSPYYSGEEALKIQLTLQEEAIGAETFAGGSFMARPLLLCLAMLDMKADCQALWSDFSKLTHRYFEFSCTEDYLTPRALTGCEVSKIYSETYEWTQLKVDATPKASQLEPLWLQSLWWQVAPHRADAASMTAALQSIICVHKTSPGG